MGAGERVAATFGEQPVPFADHPVLGVGVIDLAEAFAEGFFGRLDPDLHHGVAVGGEHLFELLERPAPLPKFFAGEFILGGGLRRARHPIPDDDGDVPFGRHHLPVRPEEGAPAQFGRSRVGRADADAARVEPFRQLVGEFRGPEAVVAAEQDDRASARGREPALGGEEAEVERGAGAFKGGAGDHRGEGVTLPPSDRKGSEDSVTAR